MNFIYKNLLLICLLVTPFISKAQFGYVGAGVAMRSTKFESGRAFLSENTRHTAITFELTGMYRPLRFLGIGASVAMPIHQSSVFSFANARTTEGSGSFNGFGSRYGSSTKPELIPQKFDYSFEQSIAYTFIARLYAAPNAGVYLDFRFSIMTLIEQFVFERNGTDPDLVENLHFTYEIPLAMPGIGIGIQHHLTKNIYFDLSANLDFVKIEEGGFEENVVYSKYTYTFIDDDIDEVTLKSQTSGSHASLVFQFSLGYLF